MLVCACARVLTQQPAVEIRSEADARNEKAYQAALTMSNLLLIATGIALGVGDTRAPARSTAYYFRIAPGGWPFASEQHHQLRPIGGRSDRHVMRHDPIIRHSYGRERGGPRLGEVFVEARRPGGHDAGFLGRAALSSLDLGSTLGVF